MSVQVPGWGVVGALCSSFVVQFLKRIDSFRMETVCFHPQMILQYKFSLP